MTLHWDYSVSFDPVAICIFELKYWGTCKVLYVLFTSARDFIRPTGRNGAGPFSHITTAIRWKPHHESLSAITDWWGVTQYPRDTCLKGLFFWWDWKKNRLIPQMDKMQRGETGKQKENCNFVLTGVFVKRIKSLKRGMMESQCGVRIFFGLYLHPLAKRGRKQCFDPPIQLFISAMLTIGTMKCNVM